MSNMFMGTLTIKGPKTSTAMGMSLEEMDRPVSIIIVMMAKIRYGSLCDRLGKKRI